MIVPFSVGIGPCTIVLKQILHWLMSCWIAALQAAEEGDMATAAQLWQAMQADSILPSRKVLNNYLM